MHLSYLEVRGSLESLVADAADVAAVFAVGLSAVAPQRVGILEHLVTVIAPVLVLCPWLAVLPSLVVGSDLEKTNSSVWHKGKTTEESGSIDVSVRNLIKLFIAFFLLLLKLTSCLNCLNAHILISDWSQFCLSLEDKMFLLDKVQHVKEKKQNLCDTIPHVHLKQWHYQ